MMRGSSHTSRSPRSFTAFVADAAQQERWLPWLWQRATPD
jgi:hypothetical protein